MADYNKLTDEFVEDFFITVLSDRDALELALPHVKFQYFQNAAQKHMWQAIANHYRIQQKAPSIGLLAQMNKTSKEFMSLLATIREGMQEREALSLSEFSGGLQKFLREVKFVELNEKMVQAYNRGDKDGAYVLLVEGVNEMNSIILGKENFEKIFENFIPRHSGRIIDASKDLLYDRKIGTGFLELDEHLHGGPERGETFLWMGGSGMGKSLLLQHLSIAAARRGKNVVHFAAEGGRRQILNRFDASWTGTDYYQMKMGLVDESNLLAAQKAMKGIQGEIFVRTYEKFGEKTLMEMYRAVKELQQENEIHMVVCDYLTLFNPGDGRSYEATQFAERLRRQRLGEISKDIAMELDVMFHTASQTTDIPPQQRNDPKFHLTRHNLPEFKGMLNPFDYLVTLNCTEDEYKDKIRRLWLDKGRDYEADKSFTIAINPEKSRYYDRMRTQYLLEEQKAQSFLSSEED